MKLIQISVFLENKKGRLSEVCSLLGSEGINIRALTIAESEDFGVLRMVVDKPDETLSLLKKNSFVANLTEIVAVEVEDKPGGLSDVLKILCAKEINVEYMYGFIEKHSDKALLVFRFENNDQAIEVLKSNNIKIVNKDDVLNL